MPANLQAFRRFRSYQRWSIIVIPLIAVVLEITAIVVLNLLQVSDRTFDLVTAGVAFSCLGVGFVLMGYWEVKKGLVFRKDLRERTGDG